MKLENLKLQLLKNPKLRKKAGAFVLTAGVLGMTLTGCCSIEAASFEENIERSESDGFIETNDFLLCRIDGQYYCTKICSKDTVGNDFYIDSATYRIVGNLDMERFGNEIGEATSISKAQIISLYDLTGQSKIKEEDLNFYQTNSEELKTFVERYYQYPIEFGLVDQRHWSIYECYDRVTMDTTYHIARECRIDDDLEIHSYFDMIDGKVYDRKSTEMIKETNLRDVWECDTITINEAKGVLETYKKDHGVAEQTDPVLCKKK